MAIIICILIGVSFLSLLEQKGLRYIQIRKGPNKAGVIGLLQPFCDAIKLFSKEYIIPLYSNYWIYYFSPVLALLFSLLLWICFPYFVSILSFKLRILFILCVLRMGVYSIILAGWSSNSNYTLLGRLRAIAQTLSYEVCLILILIVFLFIILDLSLLIFFFNQHYIYFLFINIPVSFIIMIIFLAETNRSPFDFAEGESELVSGFNIEYIRGGFTLIFLAEYIIILILGILFSLIFIGGSFNIKWVVEVLIFRILIIWIRGCFPRLRYDNLIYFCWYYILSITILILLIVFVLKYALWFNI